MKLPSQTIRRLLRLIRGMPTHIIIKVFRWIGKEISTKRSNALQRPLKLSQAKQIFTITEVLRSERRKSLIEL